MTRSRDIADQQENLGGAVAPFVAGKNKIINGDFGIWQRGTTATVTGAYGGQISVDRYVMSSIGGSTVASQQTFTAGTAPVTGYESQYFLRLAPGASVTYIDLGQKIEDVRTFANQTVTVSFWAKASSTVAFTPLSNQFFGSGGSAAVNTYGPSAITLTTSWARYTQTFTIPSVAGKTIGASSGCAIYLTYTSGTLVSNNIDIWGWQVESGNVATPFTTASGTIGGELALCQRYFTRYGASAAYIPFGTGFCFNSTGVQWTLPFKVRMRTNPTMSFAAGNTFATYTSGGVVTTGTSMTLDRVGDDCAMLSLTVASGLTAGQAAIVITNGPSAAFIDASAEL